MTPEPSKEEPKGVVPSKADLERARGVALELNMCCSNPIAFAPECQCLACVLRENTAQVVAQALAELRAEGESFVAEAVRQVEASDKLYRQQCQKINTLEAENDRLTSALARAQEALLECEVDIKDSLGVLSKETEEMVKQALSDPIGQIVFEKWKKMGAVVEAARACYEEDDFITENSPGSFERDKKLGEALEALDAKGEGK